ncbi:Hypothetical predicted protein [Cloeon dipterum]|uniref:Uncharacterized protein n=1 Tax=Cloeon dipterum TaxID=197152 RepID=A0A8S1E3Y7_9INSE|nr:Hypothetical predicted protein [Cloeon dipterum]
MLTWIDYHTQYLNSGRIDAELCGFDANMNLEIYLARTLHQGYYVPGFALNGVGYFVSREWELFPDRNFQVLVEAEYIEFDSCSELANGIVVDDLVAESEQIKIGSFEIDGVRYCGLVDGQYSVCIINFFGILSMKQVPEFEVFVRR